jgi:hypothetical protein
VVAVAPPVGRGWMAAGPVTGGGGHVSHGISKDGGEGGRLVGGRRGGEVDASRGDRGGGGVGGSPGKKKSCRIRTGGDVW